MKARAALLACLLAAAPVLAQTIAQIRAQAEAGDANAQFVLGEAYRTGQGVTPDRDQAIAWFRKAADSGDTRAADAMGLLLFSKGERKESIGLLQAASGRQDARALYLLGTAYFNGDGVSRDLPRAYAEMRAAAAKGLPQAVRSLGLMEPYINAQDRAAADLIRPGEANAPAPVPPPVAAVTDAAPPPAYAVPQAPMRTIELPPSAPPEPTPPPAPKPKPAPPAAATGKWRVQLGALISQDKAEEHWRTLLKKVPSLARLSHVAVQAGSFWRLQASGLASKAEAQEQCAAVIAKKGDCIVLAP